MNFSGNIRKTGFENFTIFSFSLLIVSISLISLFFPALFVLITSEFESEIEYFELGAWAFPVILVNIFLFVLGILYYSKKLSPLQKTIKFITNFEVSKNVSVIIFTILIGLYIGITVNDLNVYEGDEWTDFSRIEVIINDWPNAENPRELTILHVKNFLLKLSVEVFQNIKVVPYLASISLIIVTYFFTVNLSGKRFGGLVAVAILLQSYTFLKYDTISTYSNFWTLFYILSIYAIYKKWYISPISFVLSIFSKPLTIAFFPITILIIHLSEIPIRKKIYLIVVYGIIGGLLAGIFFFLPEEAYSSNITFNYSDLLKGFATLAFQIRFDGLVLIFLLPLSIFLFIKARKGLRHANVPLMLITGVLLSAPILDAFTGFNLHPYRYVPLIVFFAIGVGTLFSNNIRKE